MPSSAPRDKRLTNQNPGLTHFFKRSVAICPAAGKGLKNLNAQQSENILDFLRNPFF